MEHRKMIATAPGAVLIDRREDAGMTVEELADAAGVSVDTIVGLEKGGRVDDFARAKLAEIFKVLPAELTSRYVALTPAEIAARNAEADARNAPAAVALRELNATAKGLKHSRAIRALARHIASGPGGDDLAAILHPEDLAALEAQAELTKESPVNR